MEQKVFVYTKIVYVCNEPPRPGAGPTIMLLRGELLRNYRFERKKLSDMKCVTSLINVMHHIFRSIEIIVSYLYNA